ncbi:MAG: 30S ribosomal protein S11 [Verrucomicrobiota bacterium]|nr:30S ribosomal protein S11 [Verrucomicrobiota bacterium]
MAEDLKEQEIKNIEEENIKNVEKSQKTEGRNLTDIEDIDIAPAEETKVVKGKRGSTRSGIANVIATFNNTKISISDRRGNVLAWSSGGKEGFKGSRQSTSYAAQLVGESVAKQVISDYGMQEVDVKIKGAGSGRESAVKGIAKIMRINMISDITPVPHNGCRPRKKRRI